MDEVKQKEKALQKRDRAYDHVFSIVLVVVVIVVGFYMYHFYDHQISLDPDDWGVFGDFIGGALNPLLAFFSFMLLLINLKLQREQLDNAEEQLKLNQEELKLTREELKKAADAQVDSAKVMNEQLKTQALQQFDSLFFSLLNQLATKVTDLQMNPHAKTYANFYQYYFENSFGELAVLRQRILEHKELSLFFIFLYQILRNIDDKLPTYKLKKDYSNILRSLIPEYINRLLLVNCAVIEDNEFKKFKELLVKFEFLEHIQLCGGGIYSSAFFIHASTYYSVRVHGKTLNNVKIYNSVLFDAFSKTSNFHKILISLLENTKGFKKVKDSYKDMSFVKELTENEFDVSKFSFFDYNSANDSYLRIKVDANQIDGFELEKSALYLRCNSGIEYKLELNLTESGDLLINSITI